VLASRLWWLAVRVAGRRRVPACEADVRRFLYRHLTQRMGVRMTEALRDRLRQRWLRVVRPGEDGAADAT